MRVEHGRAPEARIARYPRFDLSASTGAADGLLTKLRRTGGHGIDREDASIAKRLTTHAGLYAGRRFASRAMTHLPSGSFRRIVSV